ncbi:MAG: FtsX-like permease family protein [Spirochaetaceae bacterium]|nr:FtsX-like permease family protein [Spirochaetaceae bacterium]
MIIIPLGGDERGRSETLLLPLTTMQSSYNLMNRVGWFSILLTPQANTEMVEQQIKELLADRHDVHPDDRRAIGSWNSSKEFKSLQGLFSGINVFLWIVGLGTLMAGMIGVSNIMLIIVKERTKEIGIRKTLGATPASVITMILQEAFIITAVAGYSGVILAVAVMEGVTWFMGQSQMESQYFSDPEISLPVALVAMVLLVIAGVLAGLFPAIKASRIHPVEALREE